jgi:hypothetical protein
VAIAPTGDIRWRIPLSEKTQWSSTAADWGAFTPTGDLVVIASEREILWNGPGGAGSLVTLAHDERLVCLSPEGSVKWEQSLPSSVAWTWPRSTWDLQVMWSSRMGLRRSKLPGDLITGPNGTIHLTGRVNGRRKLWTIRTD